MSSAICWKNVVVVRPQPGHAVTIGVNERRPSRLKDLLRDHAPPRSDRRSARGVSETRIVSPMPSCSRIARPAVLATMPFDAHTGLGESEVQRIVAAAREASDRRRARSCTPRHLRRDDDPIMAEARSPRRARAERSAARASLRCTRRAASRGSGARALSSIIVREEVLVERYPSSRRCEPACRCGFAISIDRAECSSRGAAADVARVDAVLGQRRGALG